jgi:hypothetical protein
VQRAPGIPCALCFAGRNGFVKNSDASRRGNAELYLNCRLFQFSGFILRDARKRALLRMRSACPGCCAAPQARSRASSTRYGGALLDPGSIVHSASAWVPALPCIVKNAAPRPGHKTHCFTLSQDEVLDPHGEERGNAARLEPRGQGCHLLLNSKPQNRQK